MAPTRREFLAAGLAYSAGLPGLVGTVAGARAKNVNAKDVRAKKILVVLHLEGGNDGLNTVVPCTEKAYYKARPTLALPAGDLLLIDDGRLGLHPALAELHTYYNQGNLAIFPSVGLCAQDAGGGLSRSHVRAAQIWHSAQPDIIGDTGWLGRYLDGNSAGAAFFNDQDKHIPLLLSGGKKNAVRHVRVDCGGAAGSLDRSLAKIADLILTSASASSSTPGAGGAQQQIYCLTVGGFDTHAAQAARHGALLRQLSQSLHRFFRDLGDARNLAEGVDKSVMVLIHSEFGRRLFENNAGGSDHGSTGLCLVAGAGIKGGIFGSYKGLESVQAADQDFAADIDFRTIYATILERWLGADNHNGTSNNR